MKPTYEELLKERGEALEEVKGLRFNNDQLMWTNSQFSSVIRSICMAFDDNDPENAKRIAYGAGDSWRESLAALKADLRNKVLLETANDVATWSAAFADYLRQRAQDAQ